MSDVISEILGVEPREIIRPEKVTSLVPKTLDEFTQMLVDNKKADYVRVRDNLTNVIAEVEMVVGDAVTEVRTNPSARMYETFSLLVRTFADLNKDLIGLTTISLDKPNPDLGNQDSESNHITNAVFVGTSDDLIRNIKHRGNL